MFRKTKMFNEDICIGIFLARFMVLPAPACTSNLHEPHQNKNQSLSIFWRSAALKLNLKRGIPHDIRGTLLKTRSMVDVKHKQKCPTPSFYRGFLYFL